MSETIKDLKRTHLCGEVSEKEIKKQVTIMGWVQKRRDHGGVIFTDIRDRSGIVQVVFNPEIGEVYLLKQILFVLNMLLQ